MSDSEYSEGLPTTARPRLEPHTGSGANEAPYGPDPFTLLCQANQIFSASLDLDEIVPAVLGFVMNAMPVSNSSLWLKQAGSEEMVCYGALGSGSEEMSGSRKRTDSGLFERLLGSGQTISITDTCDEPGHGSTYQIAPRARSLLCAPLSAGAASMAPLHPGMNDVPALEGEAIIGAIVLTGENPHTFDDAHRKLLEALITPASVAIGNAQLYTRASREIGERIGTEQALRESESHYRALIETSPDAIFVTNLTGTITLCNGRALDLYGCTDRTHLIGKHLFSVVAPETRVDAAQHFRRVCHGEATGGIELTHLRQDGTTFDVEFVASLIADNSGEANGIVGFIEDITPRKDAQRAIQRHNLELRILNAIAIQISQTHDLERLVATALDHSLEALEVDTGWAIVFAGDQKRTGLSQALIVERGSMRDPSFADRKIALREWLEQQVRTAQKPIIGSPEQLSEAGVELAPRCQIVGVPLLLGSNLRGVLAVVGLDHGHPRPLRVQQVQLLTAIGHQVSTAIENARLSAQAAEVDMLRELDKMRSDLLASFSHDLRSPLGIITMTCSTLLRKDIQLDGTTHDEMLADIQLQSDRLLRLVEGILDLGRLQNNHLMLRRDMFDLGDLIRRLADTVGKVSQRHHLDLQLPDFPLWVFADADRVEQVVYNLLDNAIKYSPSGGSVQLCAGRLGHRVLVSVTDEGVGIAPDQLDLIFERFYRVRSDATKHISGVGLGLPICKGIIEAHGGEIWAESQLDRGTTLHFTLPAAPELAGIPSTRE